MYKLRTILYQFNRPVFVFNMILSLVLIYCRSKVDYPAAVFVKFCGYGVVMAYQYFTANQTYFYFRNAGYSIKWLYVYSIIADLIIFSILYLLPSIIYAIIHA